MFREITGSKQVHVRAGYSDSDTYREGYCCAATGNLDAPDYIPHGSVRIHNTMVRCPQQSHGHRDMDQRPIGCGHDGPEAVPPTISADQRNK